MMNDLTSPGTRGYTGTYVLITTLCPPKQEQQISNTGVIVLLQGDSVGLTVVDTEIKSVLGGKFQLLCFIQI